MQFGGPARSDCDMYTLPIDHSDFLKLNKGYIKMFDNMSLCCFDTCCVARYTCVNYGICFPSSPHDGWAPSKKLASHSNGQKA
jgi:hypothetical protein